MLNKEIHYTEVNTPQVIYKFYAITIKFPEGFSRAVTVDFVFISTSYFQGWRQPRAESEQQCRRSWVYLGVRCALWLWQLLFQLLFSKLPLLTLELMKNQHLGSLFG